jgi:hypothetical protein
MAEILSTELNTSQVQDQAAKAIITEIRKIDRIHPLLMIEGGIGRLHHLHKIEKEETKSTKRRKRKGTDIMMETEMIKRNKIKRAKFKMKWTLIVISIGLNSGKNLE